MEDYIFEESLYDINKFFEFNREYRDLTGDEITAINALCETAINFNFCKKIVLGPGYTHGEACIFKIEKEKWIVWTSLDRNSFSYPQLFDNIIDACNSVMVRVNYENIDECVRYFNSIRKEELDDWHLEKIAKSMNYIYVPTNRLTLTL